MRARTLATAALALVAAALAGGANCNNFGGCECFPCQSAITLNVFDEDSLPLGDWIVEATLNGLPVSTDEFCDPAVRFTPGSCSFGFETGVYRITVRAPGFEPRQLSARFAAKSGEDCCQSCLPTSQIVNAILERE